MPGDETRYPLRAFGVAEDAAALVDARLPEAVVDSYCSSWGDDYELTRRPL